MRITTLLVLALACAACTVESNTKDNALSNTLALNQINGSNGAFSDGQKLEVFVAMLGPDGFVKLGGGDTITVDVNGTVVPTRERIEDGKVHYIADVTPAPAEPVVTTTLTHGAEKAVGKNSLAPNFELKSPPTTAKTGDAVEIGIDMSADAAARAAKIRHRIKVTGECIDKGEQSVDAQPPYPLILNFRNIQVTGDSGCEVEVTVRLETDGEPYTGFKGGGFEGVQSRSFKLALTK